MTGENEYLGQGFVDSWQRYPEQTAIVVDDKDYTYADLGTRSLAVKEILGSEEVSNTENVGLLTGKSIGAYAGILGTLFAGKAYVPMKPDHPIERNKQILEDSKTDVILVDGSGIENVLPIIQEIGNTITIITLPGVDKQQQDHLQEENEFGTINITEPSSTTRNPDSGVYRNISSDKTAYILFTSGSTGRPKGVPVSHKNARAYLDYILERFDFNRSDRFSQFFDFTFDPSVHDMFVCWGTGASLHTVPEGKRMAPGSFITEEGLTVWYSVPSTARFMSEFGQVSADSYPDLRYSLFSGEALSGRLSENWQKAAPNSTVVNLYGPTEATINITFYEWEREVSEGRCKNGITPIGKVFESHQYRVVNQSDEEVQQGEEGELLVSGTQVFDGYLNRPNKTEEAFETIDGSDWYRTGDLVQEAEDGVLKFISRIDNQIQVRGHRVELLEVESVIRDIVDKEMVAAVGWPVEDGIAQSIHAFIADEKNDVEPDQVIPYCSSELPDYMVPKEIHLIEEMPLNVNGKIDRDQLFDRLAEDDMSPDDGQ